MKFHELELVFYLLFFKITAKHIILPTTGWLLQTIRQRVLKIVLSPGWNFDHKQHGIWRWLWC